MATWCGVFQLRNLFSALFRLKLKQQCWMRMDIRGAKDPRSSEGCRQLRDWLGNTVQSALSVLIKATSRCEVFDGGPVVRLAASFNFEIPSRSSIPASGGQ